MADTMNQPRRFSGLYKQHASMPTGSKAQAAPIPFTDHPASSSNRTSIQTRRAKSDDQRSSRSSVDRRRHTSLPPQLSPLIVSTNPSPTMSPSDRFMDKMRELSNGNALHSGPETPHETYTKLVAFEFPPKETARCHSPSWEAYERRKIEKKMEKKERGESRKDGCKKLSKKPPPPSPLKTAQHASASEADVARGRGRERAESTAAASSSSQEGKPARKARSRSGSFVSMLRAPFEFRRLSTDRVNDPGFIGGIKLELQRHAHQQHNLDSSAMEDEFNVHPALRKNNQDFQPQLASPGTPSGTDQRRYPPITRASKCHQKTAACRMMSPAAPAIPDVSKIDKWRTSLGLKAGSRPPSLVAGPITGEESSVRGPGDNSTGCAQQEHLPLATKGPGEQHQSPPPPGPSSSEPTRLVSAAGTSRPSGTLAHAERNNQSESEDRRAQKHSNNESVSSTSSAATGFKTAPSTPPPPEPPRRSPRRHSAFASSSVESTRPVPTPTHQQPQQKYADTQASTDVTKPKKRHSRYGWTEGATSSPTTSRMSSNLPSPSHNGHLPTSSSEDSCDDDFHSASSVSTPATSRPQSEQGMPRISSGEDTPASVHSAVRACFSKTYPLPTADNSEDEEGLDPIQAAAEKVLAVFNEIPVQRPDPYRRSNSYASLATDASFEPSASERPLNLGPKNKSTDPDAMQNPSSPACYLKRARKQPPTAVPPTRSYKQRLGPPTSFVPPADGFNAANDKPKPESAALDPFGRHIRHRSTPQLPTSDRDRIAKIFVECCACKHYHDIPSNLYKAMSNPEDALSLSGKCGYAGALSMTVRCSWCKHEMSVRCCSVLSTTVYIQERLH
ncbi:hypothetical protein E4U41_000865 [Claviceps citrina]|nr:hypothetical protein E4U41_000865 [Claviceps citrina]